MNVNTLVTNEMQMHLEVLLFHVRIINMLVTSTDSKTMAPITGTKEDYRILD